MAKGNIAKQNVAKKIAEVFGSDFVGEFDKKLYLWSEENGEKVQIAISMTCPKILLNLEILLIIKLSLAIDLILKI